MDFIGPFASSQGNKYILVLLFKKVIFPHFGVPWVLISDNGAQFIGKKLDVLLK